MRTNRTLFAALLALGGLLLAPVASALADQCPASPTSDAAPAPASDASASDASAAPHASASTAPASPTLTAEPIHAASEAAWYRQIVEALASDEMAGRRTGTPGGELARDYLLAQLNALLARVPGARVGTQQFDVTRGIRVVGTPRLSAGNIDVGPDEGFAVAPFSGSGSATAAPLVFAGYGIVAPELDWDDYAGIDPAGAVLIVVRGEPQAAAADSRFAGDQPSVYSDLRRKAATARDRGAAALLLIENPLTGDPDELPEPRVTWSAANFDVPVLHVRRAVVEHLLEQAGSAPLTEILSGIDSSNVPASAALGLQATVDVQVERDLADGYNVFGVLPPVGGVDEYVVIGAHYDHLGIGGSDSLSPGEYGRVHYGADDNASGVAAALQLFQRAASNPLRQRGVVVALFDAEEIGVVGSVQFAAEPPVPQESIVAMVNFDMVGRMRDERVIVGGAGTAVEFEALLEDAAAASGLTLERDASGFGASDHVSFVRHDIPVLFFFTGPHEDYHRPSDTPDKLDYAGLARVVGLVDDVLERLLATTSPLSFVEVAPPAPTRSRGGLNVTLGTIPAYVEGDVQGMAIGDVMPDGPAQRAGLKGGDVIVQIGDKRVGNIYDFMFALEGRQPGETVVVAVLRDGAEIEFEVTLAARGVQQ